MLLKDQFDLGNVPAKHAVEINACKLICLNKMVEHGMSSFTEQFFIQEAVIMQVVCGVVQYDLHTLLDCQLFLCDHMVCFPGLVNQLLEAFT